MHWNTNFFVQLTARNDTLSHLHTHTDTHSHTDNYTHFSLLHTHAQALQSALKPGNYNNSFVHISCSLFISRNCGLIMREFLLTNLLRVIADYNINAIPLHLITNNTKVWNLRRTKVVDEVSNILVNKPWSFNHS